MADNLFSSKYQTFEAAFPEIENAVIKVAFLRGGGRETQTVTFTKENYPGHGINCINPSCKNGGLPKFTIPILIKRLITTNELEGKELAFCRGGLYRGKTRYNDCGWSYRIEITIQRKGDS